MNHYFNVELAKQYGIEEAVIIENLYFWIKKNVANKTNAKEGRYWTYNSNKAFEDIFPYISGTKIYRTLKYLEDCGFILKGSFNKEKLDRTNWYSFSDEALGYLNHLGYDVKGFNEALQNDGLHFSNLQNGFCQNETTIPYNKHTYNKLNKEDKDKSLSKKDDFLPFAAEPQAEYEKPKKKRNVTPKDDALFEECWKEYKRKGRKNKAKPYWDKLPQDVRERILPHIKAYVSTRERSYQQDFERYLKDKTYDTVVYQRNNVIYDPEMLTNNEYRPFLGENIFWDKARNIHVFFGDVETLYDGYTSENRPNEAKVFQNGYTFVWDSNLKQWVNKK